MGWPRCRFHFGTMLGICMNVFANHLLTAPERFTILASFDNPCRCCIDSNIVNRVNDKKTILFDAYFSTW